MAFLLGLSLPVACTSGGGESEADTSSDSSTDASGSEDGGDGDSGDSGDGDSGDGDTATGDGDSATGDGDSGDGDSGDGDACPAEADTDSLCAVIDGVRTDFYFKESSNVNDRWKAWTDDADENDKDSIAIAGANVTVVETLDCANTPPPIVAITLRVDDLGDTGLTQQWMANSMQDGGICTIDVTQSAQLVDDVYKGTFSGVLFNSSDGTTKIVTGVFSNTLR